jgi:hypothetical protein
LRGKRFGFGPRGKRHEEARICPAVAGRLAGWGVNGEPDLYFDTNSGRKAMKKYVAAAAAVVALAIPATASAKNCTPVNAIGENPAFQDSGMGSIENANNTELRFGYGGRIAIPGEAGDHANESSAVSPYSAGGSGGIVDPNPGVACD